LKLLRSNGRVLQVFEIGEPVFELGQRYQLRPHGNREVILDGILTAMHLA
jgi:hypothetical protein